MAIYRLAQYFQKEEEMVENVIDNFKVRCKKCGKHFYKWFAICPSCGEPKERLKMKDEIVLKKPV